MATRRLVAAAHVAPDARPRAGASVSAMLVHAVRRTAVDAWVVSTGQRVAGAAVTAVQPDGTWSLELYPNDQLATPDGGATAWAITVAGFSRVLIQLPSGGGAADFYALAAAQTPLDPGEIAALAAHLADTDRHVPPGGAVGQIVMMGVAGAEWATGSGVTDPDALHASLRLAEFDDDSKRAQARANLGIESWDGGTF